MMIIQTFVENTLIQSTKGIIQVECLKEGDLVSVDIVADKDGFTQSYAQLCMLW